MKIPINNIKLHRRHFQLLELMVAIFILLVCIVPTMRIFNSIYLAQHAIIRENQRDHLAHLVHAKFTEQLYKNGVPLEENMKNIPIELHDPGEIYDQLRKLSYQCIAIFTVEKTVKDKQKVKPVKHLCELVITMKDLLVKPQEKIGNDKQGENHSETSYRYSIYISRTTNSEGNDDATSGSDESSSQNEVEENQTNELDRANRHPETGQKPPSPSPSKKPVGKSSRKKGK